MRLYSRTNATAVDDPTYGRIEAGEDGGFDFPNELGAHMHSFHVAGKPMWETDIERQRRLIAEEAARRADPATLLAAVEQLVAAAAKTPALAPAEVKKTRRRKPADAAPDPADDGTQDDADDSGDDDDADDAED